MQRSENQFTSSALTPPASASRPAVRILTAPLAGRSRAELLYALLGLPLAIAGVLFIAVSFYAGVILSIALVGLPLIAAALLGARSFGSLHRNLARRLLGEEVAPPAPLPPAEGIVDWTKSGLRDGPGWRAVAYLVLKLPVGALCFVVGLAFWGYALFFLGYPLWWQTNNAMELGTLTLDTWPAAVAIAALGLVLLFSAPWAVHGVLMLDRFLIRALLGPTKMFERMRELQETRAIAVDDSAATLRRIERDLHDGAQARLVAVAMNLGRAKERLANDLDATPNVAGAHELIDSAYQNAKEAIVELRDVTRAIHPPILDTGLDGALASLATRSPVPVELEADINIRPSPAIESIAYFCAAELLANVAKHSGATRATLSVTQAAESLVLRVGDDGVGGAVAGAGSGLAGLIDRVRSVDGNMDISSPPGGPTVITVELPSHA